MEFTGEKTVTHLETEVLEFASRWTPPQADVQVEAKLTELRHSAQVTTHGVTIDLSDADTLERAETQFRKQHDIDAFIAARQLETDLKTAAAILDDRIQAAMVLPSNIEPLIGTQARQTEELIELLAGREFRERFATMPRRNVVALYQQADEATQAGRRLVNFLEGDVGNFLRLQFRDEPEHDAEAVLAWQKALEARRLARVPKEWLEWRARLAKAAKTATFKTLLGHLESGRGIAVRPKLTRVAIG